MPDLIDPLRPARRDDAATIAAYHRRCWQTSFRSITDPEVLAYVEQSSMDDLIALWHQRMADDSPQRVVVATDSADQAIGHVMVDGAELVHLFIDPDHHREGWGRVLLEIGEAMIRENGHRVAELDHAKKVKGGHLKLNLRLPSGTPLGGFAPGKGELASELKGELRLRGRLGHLVAHLQRCRSPVGDTKPSTFCARVASADLQRVRPLGLRARSLPYSGLRLFPSAPGSSHLQN